MRGIKLKILCLIALLFFCFTFNSCKISEDVLQSSAEVDFLIPKNVQIFFNDHIYNCVIDYDGSRLQLNFSDEKDLLDGAYACLTNESYKITYKDMVFSGDFSQLSKSFLPSIIYEFLSSFDKPILLDLYDKQKECYYLKKSINSFFITLECYERDEKSFYSIEIK